MFAGHYAAALAAKAAAPKAPLWTLVAGSQLIDIGWSILIAAGVERGASDPNLPGSPFILSHMPWTHSLLAVIGWSLLAGTAAKYTLRLSTRTCTIIAAVVFSHWLLDLLVHRPDLELYPGGPKAGFGLWNAPVAEQAIEMGLIAVAGVWWSASRQRMGQPAWPAAAFITFLVALQIIVMYMPPPPGPLPPEQGLLALAVYLAVTAVALPLDRGRGLHYDATR